MKKLVLILLIFVLGLLASLPARTVLQFVPLASQGVYLSGVQGPWYRGDARLLQIQTPQGLLQFNNARWTVQWADLLRVRLAVALAAQFDNRPLTANVAINSEQQLFVDDLAADINLETLRPFMRQLSVPVSGALSVRDLDLQMPLSARWPQRVQGQAALSNVVVSLPMALLDLGSAQLLLNGDADALHIEIADYQGHYGLEGGIKLLPPSIYELGLRVQPDGSVDEQTVQGMRFMLGAPVNGRYFLNYSGRW